ncbi:MAG: tryptophan synthase subunit alpha [Clostridiales bacterium]|jgi:tryptophan synthase alpha chain|nr:tryptophan synthase subunit alpha [Clostridiales bacterium]
MNRLAKAFEKKKALIVFVAAGDPNIEATQKLVVAAAQAGADIVQIGVPFSDPVASSPEVQQADQRALAKGCTLDQIFDMAAQIREKVEIPLILKTYMNPIFVYGKTRFMGKCKLSGIDGVIVPDLPFEEREELVTVCTLHGVARIPVIAQAAMDRIGMVAKDAEGFIIMPMLDAALTKLVKAFSPLPCVVGLDAPTAEQAREAVAIADGLSIESAIVRLVALYGANSVGHVKEYIEKMRKILI